jgi:hypothetical protein
MGNLGQLLNEDNEPEPWAAISCAARRLATPAAAVTLLQEFESCSCLDGNSGTWSD